MKAFALIAGVTVASVIHNASASIVPERIVVPEARADFIHPGERNAAEELQEWIGRMTGKLVPIVTDTAVAGPAPEIRVGRRLAAKKFPADMKALAGTDGFAVRTDGDSVYVFGAEPRGVLHGAYALLERNSDIIWPRPDPTVEAVYSHYDRFEIRDGDFLEKPKSAVRDWQWNGGRNSNCAHNLWGSRNRLNRMEGDAAGPLAASWIGGGRGHGIQQYADPEGNFATHPEWFPEIDGRRTVKGGQLCMTAEGLAEELHRNIAAELARKNPETPAKDIRCDFFNLTCADNDNMLCRCERCLADLDCGNGVKLTARDGGFRGAQYYLLMNRIAKLLAKTHPKARLGCYAYMFTFNPPPFELERNICVHCCVFTYDERGKITDEIRNGGTRRVLDEWTKRCHALWNRGYYGLSGDNYHAVEYGIQDLVRYGLTRAHPVTDYSAEINRENGAGSPIWDIDAISYWTINRLWWNPDQDIEVLRKTFCDRTFREGGAEMLKFYNLIRDAYNRENLRFPWLARPVPMLARRYLIDSGIAPELKALAASAEAKVTNPVSRELLRRLRAELDRQLALGAKAQRREIAATPLADGWEKAAESEKFHRTTSCYGSTSGRFTEEFPLGTTFKAAYDGEAVYFRVRCEAPDAMTIHGLSQSETTKHEPVCDDRLEFFVADPKTGAQLQLILDPGSRDGDDIASVHFGDESQWKGTWSREVTRDEKAWTMTLRVPYSDLRLAARPDALRFNVIRHRTLTWEKPGNRGRKPRISGSWTGGFVHDPGGFGLIELIGSTVQAKGEK